MANHVHVLFKVGEKPCPKSVADWKEYSRALKPIRRWVAGDISGKKISGTPLCGTVGANELRAPETTFEKQSGEGACGFDRKIAREGAVRRLRAMNTGVLRL